MIERGLRKKLADRYNLATTNMARFMLLAMKNPAMFDEVIKTSNGSLRTRDEAMAELDFEFDELQDAQVILRDGKVVLFAKEQSEVFMGVSQGYADSLDYRLPFPHVMIQFSEPVDVMLGNESDSLVAVLLAQHELTEDGFYEARRTLELKRKFYKSKLKMPESYEDGLVGNVAIGVFADLNIRKLSWISGKHVRFLQSHEDAAIEESWAKIRNLAIACIGYINCENIYLHKEGEVPDAVNRKRAKQGKKILEPYYTCRIRGVQYDSNGEPTGEGTHHGFRYDVRGHFRKLTTGKTTWVRPHQRGLQNELYIPKTYVVEKGAKVMA